MRPAGSDDDPKSPVGGDSPADSTRWNAFWALIGLVLLIVFVISRKAFEVFCAAAFVFNATAGTAIMFRGKHVQVVDPELVWPSSPRAQTLIVRGWIFWMTMLAAAGIFYVFSKVIHGSGAHHVSHVSLLVAVSCIPLGMWLSITGWPAFLVPPPARRRAR